jgi:hypothetical protein
MKRGLLLIASKESPGIIPKAGSPQANKAKKKLIPILTCETKHHMWRVHIQEHAQNRLFIFTKRCTH